MLPAQPVRLGRSARARPARVGAVDVVGKVDPADPSGPQVLDDPGAEGRGFETAVSPPLHDVQRVLPVFLGATRGADP